MIIQTKFKVHGIDLNMKRPNDHWDAMMADIVKVIAKVIASHSDSLCEPSRGHHVSIDFTVTGSATARKGEDYEQFIWQTPQPQLTLAYAVDKLNEATFNDVLRLALNATPAEKKEATEKLKERTQAGLAKVSRKFTQRCNGKVTIKVNSGEATIHESLDDMERTITLEI